VAGGLTDVLGDTRIRKPGADTSIVVKSQWAAPLSSTATVNKQPGEPAPVQTWDEPSITVSDLMAGAGTFEVSAHSGHHRHAFVKKGFVDHTHCDTTSIFALHHDALRAADCAGLGSWDEVMAANGNQPLGDLTSALELTNQ
jgi:hypothetical protein